MSIFQSRSSDRASFFQFITGLGVFDQPFNVNTRDPSLQDLKPTWSTSFINRASKRVDRKPPLLLELLSHCQPKLEDDHSCLPYSIKWVTATDLYFKTTNYTSAEWIHLHFIAHHENPNCYTSYIPLPYFPLKDLSSSIKQALDLCQPLKYHGCDPET